MSSPSEVIGRAVAAQAEGLFSRAARDRIDSLQRIILAGLEAGLSIADIHFDICVHRTALNKAAVFWSDDNERDFTAALDGAGMATQAAVRHGSAAFGDRCRL